MKICHWTSLPNHYQRAFVKELSKQCDLQVIYFDRMPPARIALGWSADPKMMPNEHMCTSLETSLAIVSDWQERVHLVPNYAGSFQRSLARRLVHYGVHWVDWSESSSPGAGWWLRAPLKFWWTSLVNKNALGTFAIGNRAERDFARRGIHRSRTAFLPYMSEQPTLSSPDPVITEFNRGRNAFLFLGSLSHRKGVDLLLNAAARVLPNAPDWTVVLVGNDSPKRTFQAMAARSSVSDQILFRGAVDPSKIPAVVAACKVLILPSVYDGWGVAINEGLLGGLAIVASHMCGAGEHLVITGRNGFRFEAGSDQQLAEIMEVYTRNSGMAEEHGAASKYVAHLIDPDINARAMLSTIRSWRRCRSADSA